MVSEQPNILFVVVDCLRSDRTFGPNRSAQIPNLQSLADNGALFTHLITVNSVTIPCMTSVFSGMYPHSHGVRAMKGFRVSDEIPLLAKILRDNGYHTYAEVTEPLGTHLHLDRGFQSYHVRNGILSSFLGQWGDEFIARFQKRLLTPPWFMYLHLWEVHQPRQVLPAFSSPQYGATNYDRAISTLDARLGQLVAALDENTVVIVTGDHGEKIPENVVEAQIERWKRPLSRIVSSKTKVAKTVRRLKTQVRKSWYRSVRTLHHMGLIESPLATVTGHGYHVYESLIRVPLVIKGLPGSQPGRRISTPIRQIDLMPTILSIAGLREQIPQSVEGRDVMPLIQGESLPSLPIFIETCQNTQEPSDFYGVRTDDWKYAVHISDDSVPEELYNLEADPDETNNLAATHPQKTGEMRTLLQQHLQRKTRLGVRLVEELTPEELSKLSKRLENLGYIE